MRFYSLRKHGWQVVLHEWNLIKLKTREKLKRGTRTRDARGSSSLFWLASLISLLAYTLLTRFVSRAPVCIARCTYTRDIISPIQRMYAPHTRSRARAYTDARETNTFKVTSAHRRSSNRITLSLSRNTRQAPLSLSRARSLAHRHTHTYSFPLWNSCYSLADNLAELVNIVEENLVVRHSDDEEEEVEGFDRARSLHAPGGAS